MARKGSDVRGATIAKAAPQVIVGCGYLTDVIISLSMGSASKDKAPLPVRFRKEGSRSQTTEIGTVYSWRHRSYKQNGRDAQSASLIGA